ncbi:MAG: Mu-like prophage major head subunit gpT family protein [Armatimonadetes bacterium]|nr:Mu-like prophage major head subunit gpT family protein [Armatimonadota bacterium]
MLTRTDIPELLEPGLRAVFFEMYESLPAQYERIATIVPSDRAEESYGWLGSVPAMREFTDERIPAALSAYGYTIRNRKWESTVAVDRDAIEDEQYGQIRLRVQQLAQEARRHQDELVFTLLASGFTEKCYDGQPFFSASHPEGGVQSNKGTAALGAASLQSAISAMMKFKDDSGRPLGIVPDTLVVPPDLKWTAMELLNSAYYPESLGTASYQKLAANVLQGSLELVVSPYLTDTNNWFVLACRRVVRPILFQQRSPVEFAALEGSTDEGFMRDTYHYGVRARYNAGFSDWRLAFGSLVS